VVSSQVRCTSNSLQEAIRQVGKQLIAAKPSELSVSNMVRRVLHFIREETQQQQVRVLDEPRCLNIPERERRGGENSDHMPLALWFIAPLLPPGSSPCRAALFKAAVDESMCWEHELVSGCGCEQADKDHDAYEDDEPGVPADAAQDGQQVVGSVESVSLTQLSRARSLASLLDKDKEVRPLCQVCSSLDFPLTVSSGLFHTTVAFRSLLSRVPGWTQRQVKHTHADGRRLKTQVIEAINELIDELDGIRSQIAEQVGDARMRTMALSAQRDEWGKG